MQSVSVIMARVRCTSRRSYQYIKIPKWDRIFRIKDALMLGVSVKTISQATGIDRWFLYEIQKICAAEKEIRKYKMETLPIELLRDAKTTWVQ